MRTVAPLSFAVALVLVSLSPACGGSTKSSIDDTGNDGGSSNDAGGSTTDSGFAGFPDAGTFCSGDTPRMMVNGAEVNVLMTRGKSIILNCCDSAELMLATDANQALFYLLWRAPAGQSPGTVDLANPPSNFSVELDLGCDPATSPCNTVSAEDHYATGFQGQISYGLGATASTNSYCINVAEQKGSPHSEIHSVSIYAPNIASAM
jgi:hypothetical protein